MKRKLGVAALLAGLAIVAMTPATTHAQQKRSSTAHATRSRGGGADQNVKSTTVTNRQGQSVPAPANKGGAKTRGASVGTLHVDNRSDYYIEIYVDGDLRGILAPWGDWYANGSCDGYTIYAVARFDTGDRLTWGPTRLPSGCEPYTWRLSP